MVPTRLGGEMIVFDVNQQLMNLLTAVRTILDHTDRNLKHRFGDDIGAIPSFREKNRSSFYFTTIG
jgi:hypothetical protein